MKLKYYLRGLGIGIAVTALLMGYSGHDRAASDTTQTATVKQTLKEAETQASATASEEEQTTIAQTLAAEKDTTQKTATEEPETELKTETETEAESESETELTSEETELSSENLVEQQVQNIEEKASALQEESQQMTITSSRPVSITVNRGDGSGTVARKLELAGIIENASEFDAYLMQHGYDKRITVGTHTVIPGSSWNELAQQITE